MDIYLDQTFQPLSHANLEVLKTSPEKPGDWDLKPGDFQNMCQIIKKAGSEDVFESFCDSSTLSSSGQRAAILICVRG